MYVFKVSGFPLISTHFMILSNFLAEMNKLNANCSELVEKTAASLNNDILQQLFVSTQQNSLKVCIQYAIRKYDF